MTAWSEYQDDYPDGFFADDGWDDFVASGFQLAEYDWREQMYLDWLEGK